MIKKNKLIIKLTVFFTFLILIKSAYFFTTLEKNNLVNENLNLMEKCLKINSISKEPLFVAPSEKFIFNEINFSYTKCLITLTYKVESNNYKNSTSNTVTQKSEGEIKDSLKRKIINTFSVYFSAEEFKDVVLNIQYENEINNNSFSFKVDSK